MEKSFPIFSKIKIYENLSRGINIKPFSSLLSFPHKKCSFPLRISSVNVTKSVVSCGY